MPSNWLSIDSNFPSFTGEESPEQQIRALHNYLFQLREGLQYSLQNLTSDNFNAAALKDLTDAQKTEVTDMLEKVYNTLNQMSAEIDSLSGRVTGAENLSGRMSAAEGEITGLKGRVTLAEGNLEDMGDRVTAAEENTNDLAGRTEDTEAAITELTGRETVAEENIVTLEERVKALEDDQTVAEMQDQVETLSSAVQVAEDGSVMIGSAENPLHLVGQIYINGVLFEQGGTA